MREMRRADRLLSESEAMDILKKGEYGILATVDGDGQPYGVPLSYVIGEGCLYYHNSNAGGTKNDNILANKKVTFTVAGDTKVLPDKFGTLFESVIVFDEAELVTDEEEKLLAFREFLNKYCQGFLPEGEEYIKNAGPKADMIKITIKNITGKRKA